MDSTILAMRAVTAVYAKQLLWPALYTVVAVYAVIFALSYWLASTFHPLWWLLALMLTPIFLAACVVWAIAFALTSRIHPKLTRTQKTLTRDIVSHVSHIAEQLGTPKFIILSRIVRDVVFGSTIRGSYLGELTHEPGEAKRKFEELRRSL